MVKKCIVFVIFTLQGNGAERVVLTLAKEMRRLGHDAHIVCFKNHIDFDVEPDLPVHFFEYQKFRILPKVIRPYFASIAFDKFIATLFGRPDLILSNLEPVDAVLAGSKLKNIHFVIHNTISQEYKTNSSRLKRVLNFYYGKSCVAVSKGVYDDLKLLLPQNERMRVIYNPVDTDFIKKSANISLIDQPNSGGYIINVGGFKHSKRHDVLLKAFAKLGVQENLVLVGKGDLVEASKQLAIELGISDKVIFAGFQSNPFPLIKGAKALVVSSDFEGLGMTILEAISLGVPVVSTDCPSGPSEILPRLNLSPVGDADALANNITAVIRFPEKYHVELAETFLLETSVNGYLSLINN